MQSKLGNNAGQHGTLFIGSDENKYFTLLGKIRTRHYKLTVLILAHGVALSRCEPDLQPKMIVVWKTNGHKTICDTVTEYH